MASSTPTSLDEARDQIDEINRKVVELLAERQAVVDELCQLKAQTDREIRDPEREAELLTHVRSVADETGLSPDLVEGLFREILEHSVEQQREQRDRPASDDPRESAPGAAGTSTGVYRNESSNVTA